jgi:hypothetical protein
MTSTPVPMITAIIAEGSFETPPSTFVDAVASLSPNRRTMGRTASTSTTPNRATTDDTNSQSQSGSAGTVASSLTRRIPTNETSGNTLSVLPRSVELGATEPPFPAKTQTPTTAGIIPNTSTMHLNTGAAHTSTSTSLGVPQTLQSTHTNRTPSLGLDEHRTAIQTTVDKLRDLVERFKMLAIESPNDTYTIILPII